MGAATLKDNIRSNFDMLRAHEAQLWRLGAGVIRLQDSNAPPKTRRYLPHWA